MLMQMVGGLSSAALSGLCPTPLRAAEQGPVQAAIPWEGNGRVFQIDSSRVQFLGALKGIMYVE